KWTLNCEQTRAFAIIVKHAMDPRSLDPDDALRMYIGGQGGTGKSTVINALREFFSARGESRHLRLCAYTGVAARNVGGVTLHAAM
ncbi:hypothetical protein CERSUDRAFT_25315, partial [Gelatoporia subvermispora B]